ncbi:MAG: tRNA pseudouridine(55) synthase TruB [Blastocatellia bacterium]|nr:MAG: tRNA pseudouridine(55) synthase TruB [Blastocatellia bacterium]
MDGILVIDKPPQLTSHDVVGQVRHILQERRIGHTGTLDPFATGVLVVVVGRATRLAQFLTGMEKEYEAIIRLGFATDTGDRTGKPLKSDSTVRSISWTGTDIEAALSTLRGDIQQIPPMYSAKKIRGEKLYELARRGEEVQRHPINVCIHEFEPLPPDGELIKDNLDGTFDFHARVVCSSGTYVRTLAEDLGKRLGIGAHLAELRRTRVGDFSINQATTLERLKSRFGEEAVGTVMLTPESALSRLPFLHLNDDDERKARHGLEVVANDNIKWTDGEIVRMCNRQGRLVAVGTYDAEIGRVHPRVVLAAD